MRAKDLINYTIPPLKLSDVVEKVQDWFGEFHINELPIVENGKFVGFFSEEMLLDDITGAKTVGDFRLMRHGLHVDQDVHYYQLLKKAHEAGSNLVAVLDDQEVYLGTVTIQDVVEAFSKMSSIHSPGTILVVSMPPKDYSMTDISRIIESEGGKILSSFVDDGQEAEPTGEIQVTIKLNLENGSNIVAALERYGYVISAIYGKGHEEIFEQERLDTLMRYLKV